MRHAKLFRFYRQQFACVQTSILFFGGEDGWFNAVYQARGTFVPVTPGIFFYNEFVIFGSKIVHSAYKKKWIWSHVQTQKGGPRGVKDMSLICVKPCRALAGRRGAAQRVKEQRKAPYAHNRESRNKNVQLRGKFEIFGYKSL